MRLCIAWISKVLGLLMLLAGALVVSTMYPQLSSMRGEYVTAGVIRDLDAFVLAHPGKWPASWSDLGDGTDHSPWTHVRFDLTQAEILSHPEVIQTAVTPVAGRYHTYPHARTQLDEVLKKVRRLASSPGTHEVSADDPVNKEPH